MVKKCAAAGCSNSHLSGRSMHRFPVQQPYRRQWVRFVQAKRAHFKEPSLTNAGAVLCGDHFAPECFESPMMNLLGFKLQRNLKKDAVPTIHAVIPGSSGSVAKRRNCSGDDGPPPNKPRRAVNKLLVARLLKESYTTTTKAATENTGVQLQETYTTIIKAEAENSGVQETYTTNIKAAAENTSVPETYSTNIKAETENTIMWETYTTNIKAAAQNTSVPETYTTNNNTNIKAAAQNTGVGETDTVTVYVMDRKRETVSTGTQCKCESYNVATQYSLRRPYSRSKGTSTERKVMVNGETQTSLPPFPPTNYSTSKGVFKSRSNTSYGTTQDVFQSDGSFRYDPRTYMITMCVTIEQEIAIKALCEMRGWPYPSLHGEKLGISPQPEMVSSCTQTAKAGDKPCVSMTTGASQDETPKDLNVIIPTSEQNIISLDSDPAGIDAVHHETPGLIVPEPANVGTSVSTAIPAVCHETQRDVDVISAQSLRQEVNDRAPVSMGINADFPETPRDVRVVQTSTLTQEANEFSKPVSAVCHESPDVIEPAPTLRPEAMDSVPSIGLVVLQKEAESNGKGGMDMPLDMDCQDVETDSSVSHKDSPSYVGRSEPPRDIKDLVSTPVVRQEAQSGLAVVAKTCKPVQQTSVATKLPRVSVTHSNAQPTASTKSKLTVSVLKSDIPADVRKLHSHYHMVDNKTKTAVSTQPGGRNPSAQSVSSGLPEVQSSADSVSGKGKTVSCSPLVAQQLFKKLCGLQQQQAGKPCEVPASTSAPVVPSSVSTPVVPTSVSTPVVPTSVAQQLFKNVSIHGLQQQPAGKKFYYLLPSSGFRMVTPGEVPASTRAPVILAPTSTSTPVGPTSFCRPVIFAPTRTPLVSTSASNIVVPSSTIAKVAGRVDSHHGKSILPVFLSPTVAPVASELDSHHGNMDTHVIPTPVIPRGTMESAVPLPTRTPVVPAPTIDQDVLRKSDTHHGNMDTEECHLKLKEEPINPYPGESITTAQTGTEATVTQAVSGSHVARPVCVTRALTSEVIETFDSGRLKYMQQEVAQVAEFLKEEPMEEKYKIEIANSCETDTSSPQIGESVGTFVPVEVKMETDEGL